MLLPMVQKDRDNSRRQLAQISNIGVRVTCENKRLKAIEYKIKLAELRNFFDLNNNGVGGFVQGVHAE